MDTLRSSVADRVDGGEADEILAVGQTLESGGLVSEGVRCHFVVRWQLGEWGGGRAREREGEVGDAETVKKYS